MKISPILFFNYIFFLKTKYYLFNNASFLKTNLFRIIRALNHVGFNY